MFWKLLVFFLLLGGLFSCTPSKQFMVKQSKKLIYESAEIRVQIFTLADNVKISSKNKFRLVNKKSGKIIYQGENKMVKVCPAMIDQIVTVESWGGTITINDIVYRGNVILYNLLGKIHAVNIVKMDDYLSSVVASEMSYTWPEEALKAQAVSARTYAYYHLLSDRNEIFDLDSTTNFQVYKGASVENERTALAVKETSGLIMAVDNRPILSFFHSTCGGKTISNQYVWSGGALSYLNSVSCPYCKDSPYFNWSIALTLKEINRALKNRYSNVDKVLGVSFKKQDGRVIEVLINHSGGNIKLTGNEFRTIFDPVKVKSLLFESKKVKGAILLMGHGFGHGVGMCQYGARGMALVGKKYFEILRYYYPGVQLIQYEK